MGRLRRQPEIQQQVCQGVPGEEAQQGPASQGGLPQQPRGHEGEWRVGVRPVERGAGGFSVVVGFVREINKVVMEIRHCSAWKWDAKCVESSFFFHT